MRWKLIGVGGPSEIGEIRSSLNRFKVPLF